jgi:signal transduction histidine kinase
MDVSHDPSDHRAATPACEQVSINQGELRSLLSSLSHELCRPLVSMRAGFDLLLGDASVTVSSEQRVHLLTMVSLCDDLLRLTRGYLDYAALVEGCRGPCLGTFSLGAIVREIDRQFALVAAANGLGWALEVSDDEVSVVTDASLCQQIFGNLVSNAMKYTPRGGTVRVECKVRHHRWYVAVIDDGPGIPSDSREKVFEPFFRLSRDEHSRIEGNGLGLSICRELTERLGGRIVLDSTPGAGTTVEVSFPLASPATPQASLPPTAKSKPRRPHGTAENRLIPG